MLSNNYEKAKEYGDKFFGARKMGTDQEELKDTYYIWKYKQRIQDLKFCLYIDKEERQYGYANKDYTVNILYGNTMKRLYYLILLIIWLLNI